MNYETILSSTAIVLSIIAFLRTVFWENRTRRMTLCERKQQVIEEALGHELVLSEMYSNVLTTDQAKYCSEVQAVLKKMKDDLPKQLKELSALRKAIERDDFTDEKQLELFRSKYSQLRMQSLCLNSELQHGLERGLNKQ